MQSQLHKLHSIRSPVFHPELISRALQIVPPASSDFQLHAYQTGQQAAEAIMAPEALSQGSEIEQPRLGCDLLRYITAIAGLPPPPTTPIDYLLHRHWDYGRLRPSTPQASGS